MQKTILQAAVCLLLGFLFISQLARAQEVSVTPPPLAYPKFSEPNTTQGKVTGTYISISGEDFELTGFGISYTGRSVLDRTEDDRNQGVGYAGGFVKIGGDLDGILLSALVNYEMELYEKSGSNLIGFIGPNVTYAFIEDDTNDYELLIGGFQLGLQYSVESNDLLLSPYIMYVNAGGSLWVNGVHSGVEADATLIGFEVLMISKGITLSGIIQQAFADDSSDTLTLQVSFNFGPQLKDSKGDAPAKTARRSGRQPAGAAGDSIWPRYRGG